MSRLNDLIRQARLKDPALADDLEREVAALADRRAFGLNFERHTPETVELPGRRVRYGDKVRVRPPRGTTPRTDERLWQVRSIEKARDGQRRATLDCLSDDGQSVAVTVADLVVVAEFRDPIYPGLESTGRLEHGDESPFNIVINAENYHALQTLLFTHREKVDCIYIDPPYNTGKDEWIYNDRYVNGDDLYRHSKWLAFMERRLVLARELLKDTGVIVVAIGDDQHHRLRMLMDQVFDESNFVSDVVWQGGRKNDSRFASASSDYMLIYGKSVPALVSEDVRWSEPKSGVDELVAAGSEAWSGSGHDPVQATNLLRTWWKGLPAGHPALIDRGLRLYDRVDDVAPGEVFSSDNLRSPNPRPNLQYNLLHPETGMAVKRHPNGWVYSRETMDKRLAEGLILFGADHTTTARFKRYLAGSSRQTPLPCFTSDRAVGSDHLAAVLGSKRFPNPKDHHVLMRWLSMVAPGDAVFVDFFGGSGSTLEAVMRLNAQDNGRRQCILVTNNEVGSKESKAMAKAGLRDGDSDWEAKGVHDFVTKPRIMAIVTGERPDGSTYADTVPANVEFFTLTYEAPLRVASHREFQRIAPLLWLRAGACGRRIEDLTQGWDVAEAYGVISDLDQVEKFAHALSDQPDAVVAFVVTDEDRLFESVVRELPENVEPVRVYEAYLRNFEIESGRGVR